MTKELLMEYFNTLFKDCFLFWKREGKIFWKHTKEHLKILE